MAAAGFNGCQQVPKPELKGEGPLQVAAPTGTPIPEYHAPSERWRRLHGEAINRQDFTERECLLCHNPQTGCQQCHKYVAAKLVFRPEAAFFWPEKEIQR